VRQFEVSLLSVTEFSDGTRKLDCFEKGGGFQTKLSFVIPKMLPGYAPLPGQTLMVSLHVVGKELHAPKI
jgi:hypothetical protein